MTGTIRGVNRAKRDCGSDAPSRTAAIGGTRVARIAEEPGRERHADADEQRDDDRAEREDPVTGGRTDPEAPRTAPRFPLRSARRNRTMSGRQEPDHDRLEDHGAEDTCHCRRADRRRVAIASPLRDGDRRC